MSPPNHKSYKHCHQPKSRYILKADVKVDGASVCSPCDKPKVRLCNTRLIEVNDCSSSSSDRECGCQQKKKYHHKKEHRIYLN